jgi:hypothetical protein
VIPAVLEGSDGVLLAIGYPGAGDRVILHKISLFLLSTFRMTCQYLTTYQFSFIFDTFFFQHNNN